MKLISRHYKKMKIAYIKGAAFVTVIAAFFLPHYQKLQNTGDNMFTIYMNGPHHTCSKMPAKAQALLRCWKD